MPILSDVLVEASARLDIPVHLEPFLPNYAWVTLEVERSHPAP
jgi:hypothetical protein